MIQNKKYLVENRSAKGHRENGEKEPKDEWKIFNESISETEKLHPKAHCD